MARSDQMVEVENRTRATIDLGTFDNPGGSPERVHVFLGSTDDANHASRAPKTKLVLGDNDVAGPIRVFPAAVWTAALRLKAAAGMVDRRDIQFHGV